MHYSNQQVDYAAEQKIYITGSHNFTARLSEEEIRTHFKDNGKVLHVEFKHRSNSAVVTFEDAGDVNNILAVSCLKYLNDVVCFIYNVKISFECIRIL